MKVKHDVSAHMTHSYIQIDLSSSSPFLWSIVLNSHLHKQTINQNKPRISQLIGFFGYFWTSQHNKQTKKKQREKEKTKEKKYDSPHTLDSLWGREFRMVKDYLLLISCHLLSVLKPKLISLPKCDNHRMFDSNR